MRQLTPILVGVAAGTAAGLLAWLAASAASAQGDALSALESRLAALPSRPNLARAAPAGGFESLAATPLLVMTTGPGAVSEPAVRLEGLSVSRRRTAALVSIADGPPEWMLPGDVRGGVKLQEVTSTFVVVETDLGAHEVRLGERFAGSGTAVAATTVGAAPSQAQGSPPNVAGPQTIPPGFRSPPPPASAPSGAP